MSDDLPLFGVLLGVSHSARCTCGHAAVTHNPCCGACSFCGNKVCPEFDPEPVTQDP